MSFYSRFSTWDMYSTEFSTGEYFYREFLQRKSRGIQVHDFYIKIQYQGFYTKGREKQTYWILHKNIRERERYWKSTEVQVLEKYL